MRFDRCKKLLPLAFAIMLDSAAFAGGMEAAEGWWVVLGSLPNPDLSAIQDTKIAAVRAAAARCGFDPFNDFSNKFRGFAPGYDVVVVGAYVSRAKARSAMRAVRRCVPGAYLAFGKHLGE